MFTTCPKRLVLLLLLWQGCCEAGGYLFSAPGRRTPSDGARGGVAVLPPKDPGAPPCGLRFGLGMLGRGHSAVDLDSNTEFGEYPWHVAILSNQGSASSKYICGGALINCNHVLTVAHCVKSLYPDELTVRVGDWDAGSLSELYEHDTYTASDIFIHERFYPGSLHNDIAIIRLNRKVNWGEMPHVAPICLPQPKDLSALEGKCWVTGWGKDAFFLQGEYQSILQEVDVDLVEPKTCETALKHAGLGYRFRMHKGWLCAGGEEGKDACSGDGGGPLVCGLTDGSERSVLAGLVSWGVGCGEAGVPGVYTNVANYVGWIYQTMSIV